MTEKENLIKKIANTMILKSPKKIENEDDKFLVFEECVLAFSDLSEEQLQSGRVKYSRLKNSFGIDTGKFRELCLSGDNAIDLESKSFRAWQSVNKAISGIGSYSSPCFKDSRISETIRILGGWKWLCGQNTDQLNTFIKNDFIKNYKGLTNINQEFDPLLKGTFNEKPSLIGYNHDEEEKVLAEIEEFEKVQTKIIGKIRDKLIENKNND